MKQLALIDGSFNFPWIFLLLHLSDNEDCIELFLLMNFFPVFENVNHRLSNKHQRCLASNEMEYEGELSAIENPKHS